MIRLLCVSMYLVSANTYNNLYIFSAASTIYTGWNDQHIIMLLKVCDATSCAERNVNFVVACMIFFMVLFYSIYNIKCGIGNVWIFKQCLMPIDLQNSQFVMECDFLEFGPRCCLSKPDQNRKKECVWWEVHVPIS